MKRVVVNVATTDTYRKGQMRLSEELRRQDTPLSAWGSEPPGCPKHADVPYAMKSYALKDAAKSSDLLLWCDSSILPIRSLEPLWRRIERDGAWIGSNGWNCAQWCADSAYADLEPGYSLEHARALYRNIPHVVATAFGLNVRHPLGRAILDEYYRYASETRAFCGPWRNTPETPCGPPEVLGHRHDQLVLSVLAHRYGVKLTDSPDVFAYSKRREDGTFHVEDQDLSTILVADGGVFN